MREIKISRGLIALVDDDDYDYLSGFFWQVRPSNKTSYATRKKPSANGKQTTVSMHREIMKAGPGQQVDHINGNGLDNRKENLRLCTVQENQYNTGPKSENSGYKGVTWHKRLRKWQARIAKDHEKYHLGYFSNKHAAAVVYNYCAKELFGEFARLNEVKLEDVLEILPDEKENAS